MFDPFGLKKESETGEKNPAPVGPPPEPEFSGPNASPGPSAKVLATFLVIDSLFVIVFGGTLAAKLYEHFTAPVAVLRPNPPPRKPKPDLPPAQDPAAEAPPAVPAPAPAVMGDAAAVGVRGDTTEAVSPPQTAPAPAPASVAPLPGDGPARPKAVPVEFKLKQAGAHKVELAGAFIVRGGKVPMSKNGDGTWDVTLYLTPDTYRYHFLVDGKKLIDPQNPNIIRGSSVITVP